MINPLLVPGDVQVNADGVRVWALNYGGVFAVGSDYQTALNWIRASYKLQVRVAEQKGF